MIIWSDLAVKVSVVQSKCETTRLVSDPNDILWVSGLERIQNGDNSFFKSCKIRFSKILNVENHTVMVYYNENVKTG